MESPGRMAMIEVSLVMPCLNEEQTVGGCVRAAVDVLDSMNLRYEVIVADSSDDSSAAVAEKAGATVIRHNKKGYGAACLVGINASRGKYILLCDADGSYSLRELPRFIENLESGADFVIGTRLRGNMEKNSMPFHHRYVGNPLLTFTVNLFFKTKLSDVHSGFRAVKRDALKRMKLSTTGMEFATEMVVAAALNRMRIEEVPISYLRRAGQSKLRSFSDGWRHLRFMLLYSPDYLFLIPGISLLFIGIFLLMMQHFTVSILGSLIIILGYQIMVLGISAKTYAVQTGIVPHSRFIHLIHKYITLERGSLLGIAAIMFALLTGLLHLTAGVKVTQKTLLVLLTFSIIAIQTVFSVFFLSTLLIERKR